MNLTPESVREMASKGLLSPTDRNLLFGYLYGISKGDLLRIFGPIVGGAAEDKRTPLPQRVRE